MTEHNVPHECRELNDRTKCTEIALTENKTSATVLQINGLKMIPMEAKYKGNKIIRGNRIIYYLSSVRVEELTLLKKCTAGKDKQLNTVVKKFVTQNMDLSML